MSAEDKRMCSVSDIKSIENKVNPWTPGFIQSIAVAILAIALLGSIGAFPMGSTAIKYVAYTGFGFAGAAFILYLLKKCCN